MYTIENKYSSTYECMRDIKHMIRYKMGCKIKDLGLRPDWASRGDFGGWAGEGGTTWALH